MRKPTRVWFGCLTLCLAIGAWGMAVTPASAQVVPPSDTDVRAARDRMGAALNAVDSAGVPGLPAVPELRHLPQPATKGPDLGELAQSHRPSRPDALAGRTVDTPELMVFVSFSMPRATLQRIVSQSERSGAVLVLRGLKGNSLTQMGEEVAQLVGSRNVTVLVHPPAFTQFKVRQVPALVLARSAQAAAVADDGCAPGSSFIRVDGDVSQDYALDLIERQAPAWADIARHYSARLSGPRP